MKTIFIRFGQIEATIIKGIMTMPSIKGFAAVLAALFTLSFATSNAFAAEPEREWTMLVFLNGHNNLDSFGKLDLNEMEKVGSTDQVNVVVQWASASAKTTRRVFVQKDSNTQKVTSPVVQEMPRVDMGDYRNLIDFVRWGHENYPARHYFVAVWNHGTGWHNLRFTPETSRNISSDDFTGNSITTTQLGEAMNEIAKIIDRKVDIYGSDACLMGMIEVAHEVKDSVEYFIGSEDLEPGAGWPYDALLARWNQLPRASAVDVAKILPEVYAASYTNGSQGNEEVTLSSFDLKELDALATSLSNLRVMMLNNKSEMSAFITALNDTLKFDFNDYADLGDMLKNMRTYLSPSVDLKAIKDVEASMKKVVIKNRATGRFKEAQGLAIWMPRLQWEYDKHQKNYRDLSFDIATQWHLLIEKTL